MTRGFIRRATAVAFLLVSVAVVYGRVGGFDWILFDDPDYVFQNRHVLEGLTPGGVAWALTTQHAGNWHPITWLSHMLDVELFGPRPGPQHLVGLLLHALNAVLLWLALERMTRAFWPSVLVATLFALHPVQVESVAWIAERKTLLSTAFGLLAVIAYADWTRRGGAGRYLAVLVSFALGLMAKPMLVTLPFLLLLLDYWPLDRFGDSRRGATVARLLVEKVPLFVLAAASSAITLLVQSASTDYRRALHVDLAPRLANAVVAYGRYLAMLVWPHDLALLYPLPALGPGAPGWPAATVAGSAALLLAVSAAVGWVALRSGRRGAFLAVGWLWFLGTLVPMIGLVQVGAQARADRYAYFSFPGLFVMVAWTLAAVVERRPRLRAAVAAASVLAVCALSFATWRQVGLWRDSETLFTATLERTRDNWRIELQLGSWLALHGRDREAEPHLREAVRIRPDYAKAQHDLAVLLGRTGRADEALAHHEAAVAADPDYVNGRYGLGAAYQERGRWSEAVEQLRFVVAADPDNADAQFRIGLGLAQGGGGREALVHLDRASELRPAWPAPLVVSARVLALARDPALRDPARAVELAQRACRLTDDTNPNALQALATALAAEGRFDEAIDAGERARRQAQASGLAALARQIDGELERYRSSRGADPARP